MSDAVIEPPATDDNNFAPPFGYNGTKIRKFNGSCLKQDKVTYDHRPVVNIYIVYVLNLTLNSFDPTLEKCLFGAVKLTKNTDIDKYRYSGYGFGFDSKGTSMFPNDKFACNVIIFGADKSSSIDADNKKKDILIFGEGPT